MAMSGRWDSQNCGAGHNSCSIGSAGCDLLTGSSRDRGWNIGRYGNIHGGINYHDTGSHSDIRG